MFAFFERLTNPFPIEHPQQPPQTIFAFCRYYSKGMWPVIIAVSILSAVIAVLEVSLFGFLGQLVDWLTESDRETFFKNESPAILFGWGYWCWVVLPVLVITQSVVVASGD